MKKKCRYIVAFVIVSIFVFCYSYFYSILFMDEIWNYGFSYNIATGLIPYRDFNMIITPFYSFLGAVFIRIFGHHLWSIHILNALLVSGLVVIISFRIDKKVWLFFPLMLIYCYPNYNFLSLFLMIILIEFCEEDFKNKDLVIGFLCGILFLTKQTVGICMFVPMIYYSENKLKSLVAYCFPILLFWIYLLWNDALYSFIDYCFLGMSDFCAQNKIYLFLPLELLICFFLGYKLVKSNFRNQKLFYSLMFQVITIPIVDDYHFMIGFLLVYYYFLEKIRIEKYKFKYYFIMLLFFTCYWSYSFDYHDGIYLYQDKNSYLYGRYLEEYIEEGVTEVSDYIEREKGNYDQVYLFTKKSYMIKLNTSYSLNKFDLINNGNLGYQGTYKYIDEMKDTCSRDRCLFVLGESEVKDEVNSQTNRFIIKYVIENYAWKEEINVFDVYVNGR